MAAVLRRPNARARKLALETLWECGMDSPSKIDPLVVCGRKRVAVIFCRIDGATGQILRRGDRAIIRVSDSIVQIGRRRFTIAHELGHFLLGHRIPTEIGLDVRAPFSEHQEREANVFAVEFLLPEEWVRSYCMAPTSFAAINAIVKVFNTSLVASARRFVELSSSPCALAYSEHGHIVWSKQSRTFPGRIPAQLRIGAGAIAHDQHARGELDTAARVVDASAWYGAFQQPTGSLVEEAVVIPEPGWGGVLSLLRA